MKEETSLKPSGDPEAGLPQPTSDAPAPPGAEEEPTPVVDDGRPKPCARCGVRWGTFYGASDDPGRTHIDQNCGGMARVAG